MSICNPIADILWTFLRQLTTASQTGYNDAEGSGQGISSHELQLRDLPSKRLLGEGLAGIGYETEWKEKRCARKEFVGVPSRIFREEAANLVGLEDHKNIVKSYGWTVDKRSCSLVLEFMDNDLLGFLQNRKESKPNLVNIGSDTHYESSRSQPLEMLEALKLIKEVAEGMKQLHDKGIEHGDLKTRNILVNYTNNSGDTIYLTSVKVADFGLVRTKRKSIFFVSRQARKLDMVQWKAPEYLRLLISLGKLEDTDETSSESDSSSEEDASTHAGADTRLLRSLDIFAADVYSFALTCSQILTGEDPYPILNWKELVGKILDSDLRPKLLDAWPLCVKELLQSCWNKDPRKRPTFLDILQRLQVILRDCEPTSGPSRFSSGFLSENVGNLDLKEISKTVSCTEDSEQTSTGTFSEDDKTGVEKLKGSRESNNQAQPNQLSETAADTDKKGTSVRAEHYNSTELVGEEVEASVDKEMDYSGGEGVLRRAVRGKSELSRGQGTTESKERKEEVMRVPETISAFDESTLGISIMGGTSKTRPERRTSQGMEVSNDENSNLRASTDYDVFLNHRGPDLKKTFVSHLDAALRRVGCHPFYDGKSLVKRENAFNSVNKALTGVSLHVAIFSPRYAESKYCLNELCDMLASQKPLIPVFYNVEPENLSQPEVGPFAKAFSYHMKKGRAEDVKRWKAALLQAAAITGSRLVENNNEMELVKRVVGAILNCLPAPAQAAPTRHPVGLKESSTSVSNMLHKMGDNVGVLGICGMGGIGKTTLAMEVYNQEQSSFKNHCFLKNVKDSKGVGVGDLQLRMVTELLHVESKNLPSSPTQWFEMIQKQKVFLVVDDISAEKQFYELILELKQLAPGSRVLITSRDSDILKSIMSDVPQPQRALYYVPPLSFSNSLELFNWCAFRKKTLDDLDIFFHDYVEKITTACGGVPLVLEVMGGYLGHKRNVPECWTEATSTLRKNEDLITSLRISYDGLGNDNEKHMFLDIACFMLGHPKYVALEVWKSVDYDFPSWTLNKLIDKCLVKVDVEGGLSMHDLLRDMGRNVIMERAREKLGGIQSHIWDPEEVPRISQKKMDLSEVLSLSTVGLKSDVVCKAEHYARMTELRYLTLDGCPMNGDFSGWSEQLRWVQWRYLPFEELPWNLKFPNLAVLDLSNSPYLTHVWTEGSEEEVSYQVLQILILRECAELKRLPQNINKLARLKFLNLEGCSSLSSLPDSIGNLVELENLDLSSCSNLTILPKSIGNLVELEYLNLSCCSNLAVLPDFSSLSSLQTLNLNECRGLSTLPESFGYLPNLEELYLKGCELLQVLPPSFCGLSNLKYLKMTKTALEELPEDFGQLQSLTQAELKDCKSLIQLPESFGDLSNLEELWLNGCELLQELPRSFSRLRNLEALILTETALEELSEDFGQLQSLRKAALECCRRLVHLPESIGNLLSLEELRLNGCESLRELPPSFCELTELRVLILAETALEELPEDFGQLQSLMKADFGGCKSLVQLPESFGNLSNLEVLWLNGCELLRKLPPSFCELTELRVLILAETALEELPEDFGKLQSLREAHLGGCSKLPDSFSNLSNLESLSLYRRELLQKLLRSIGRLKKLESLDMTGTGITDLPEDLGQLQCLLELHKGASFGGLFYI